MANQMPDTQQRVIFSVAHLVNLTRVKRLGLYTKSELFDGTIDALIANLRYIFSPDHILIKDQKLAIKLKNDIHERILVTSERLLSDLDDDEKGEKALTLYPADFVVLLIDLAKFIQLYQPTEILSEFYEQYDEKTFLKEWGDGVDSPTEENPERFIFSEESLRRNVNHIHELLKKIEDAFQLISGSDAVTEEASVEQAKELSTDNTAHLAAAAAAVASLPTRATAESTSQETSAVEGAAAHPSGVSAPELTSTDRLNLEKQVSWVFAAAREQLLYDALRKVGINPTNLPPELRDQVTLLENLLRSNIRDIALRLPADKLEQLLSGNGSITLRLSLLRTVLVELHHGTKARFFVELLKLYEQVITHTKTTATPENIERITTALDQMLSEQDAPDPAQAATIAEIRQQIQEWKRQFILQLYEEERFSTQTLSEDAFSENLDSIEPPPPPLKLHLSERNLVDIERGLADRPLQPYEQKRIQNQVARLIAGAKAELFSEKELVQNTVPAEFTTQLSDIAIQYVLSLSPDELTKLSRSPSTLIRHIKNVQLKALQDASFVDSYATFQKKHISPVERNDIVATQTELLTTIVIDELFTNQTITDASTPDNYLQKEFDHLKNYVETKVFYTVFELSTDDLIKLQLDFSQQKSILKLVHSQLNKDTTFVSEINHFYTSLTAYYERTGQLDAKEEVERSLKSSLLEVNGSYLLKSVEPERTAQEFSQNVARITGIDNPAVIKNTQTIVDSLLITYGHADTTRLIENLSPELLSITFGLPQSALQAQTIQEFRALLLAHAQARSVLISLYSSSAQESKRAALVIPSVLSATAVTKLLTPVRAVSQVSAEEGSDVTAAASNPGLLKKQQKVMKSLISEWETLSYQQQYALYYYTIKIQKDATVPVGPSTGALFAKEEMDKVRHDTYDVSKRLPFISSYLFLRGETDVLVDQFKKDAFSPATKQSSQPTALEVTDYHEAVQRYQQALALHLQIAQAEAENELLESTTTSTALVYSIAPLNIPEVVALPSTEFEDPLTPPQQQLQGQTFAPEGAPRRSRVIHGIGKLARKKLRRKLTQKAGETVAKTALSATAGAITAGAGYAISGAQTLWKFLRNPDDNPTLLFALALPIAPLMTVGGALAFGLVSFLTGNILLGLAAAPIGAYLLPWQIPGLSFRLPPAPWQNWVGSGSDQVVSPQTQSLAQMRNTTGTTSQAGQTSAGMSGQQGSGGEQSGGVSSATPQATSSAASTSSAAQQAVTQASQSLTTTASATASAAGGGSSGLLLGLSFGALLPMGGVILLMAVSAFALTVIFGAFLIPVPTRLGSPTTSGTIVGSTTSKYVEVNKVANPAKIPNNTSTPIEYTITIKPKIGYMIKIKGIKDTFSGFGTATSIPLSPLTLDTFPQESFNDQVTVEKKYTVTLGDNTTDALIMNAFVLTFDVVDVTDFVVAADETVTAAASVAVGNPKMGCWPTSGKVLQLPGGSFSHANLDAFDIANSIGTPIYAPFPGKLCDKGFDPKRKSDGTPGGYGRYASLEFSMGSATGLVLYFGHFAQGPMELSGGFDSSRCKMVNPGELIGKMDDTGYSFGSHLHYELLRNNHGVKLKDLILDAPQVMNNFNSGKAVFVNHCFPGK